MHYRSFSAEDFIQDEFFQQWVFSPNEQRDDYWHAFLMHYPSQRPAVDEARNFLLAMDFGREVPEWVVSDIKINFNAAIDRLESESKIGARTERAAIRPRRSGRMRFRPFYAAAACFLLLTVLGVFLFVPREHARELFATLTFKEAKTPKGKQRRVVLQDGTQVWLNANSVLKYPHTFANREKREVYLEGEAFFDVSQNKEKPFIVNTSGLSIKVLGTAFNVRSYEGDSLVETTLVRGKVTISADNTDQARTVTLLPNQKALFSKESKEIALQEALNADATTAWRNGWMIFDNKPFSYIKETLERRYNVTIVMQDEKSLSCTFTAKFKDKTLKEVLEIFRSTESINYWIDGDRVTINGRLCE